MKSKKVMIEAKGIVNESREVSKWVRVNLVGLEGSESRGREESLESSESRGREEILK